MRKNFKAIIFSTSSNIVGKVLGLLPSYSYLGKSLEYNGCQPRVLFTLDTLPCFRSGSRSIKFLD